MAAVCIGTTASLIPTLTREAITGTAPVPLRIIRRGPMYMRRARAPALVRDPAQAVAMVHATETVTAMGFAIGTIAGPTIRIAGRGPVPQVGFVPAQCSTDTALHDISD